MTDEDNIWKSTAVYEELFSACMGHGEQWKDRSIGRIYEPA